MVRTIILRLCPTGQDIHAMDADPLIRRLFFADSNTGQIQALDYDGSNYEVVLKATHNYIRDIDVVPEIRYVHAQASNTIHTNVYLMSRA